jgi:hypothetical protein
MIWGPVRLAACIAVIWCSAAHAIQQIKSLYTAVDVGECQRVDEERNARLCNGLPGFPIYVAEGDRGVYLSVGQKAAESRAAHQTLRPFSTLFDASGRRTTVEWRFVVRDGQPVPYATIVRYFTKDATGTGEVLVVMRVADDDVCHVAYVDALANLDAMVLARKIADTAARSNGCPEEPSVEGARGRSPM